LDEELIRSSNLPSSKISNQNIDFSLGDFDSISLSQKQSRIFGVITNFKFFFAKSFFFSEKSLFHTAHIPF
jgi:hypothetical protein